MRDSLEVRNIRDSNTFDSIERVDLYDGFVTLHYAGLLTRSRLPAHRESRQV